MIKLFIDISIQICFFKDYLVIQPSIKDFINNTIRNIYYAILYAMYNKQNTNIISNIE